MKNKEELILMYKDYEVLSFCVDYEKEDVHVLEKLNYFEKAPRRVVEHADDEHIDIALLNFINQRIIPETRPGYQKILESTGYRSGFELSFARHGLSLSNHYWYKREGDNLCYKEINFFTNKWDDSFAKAVLNRDYEALKQCDLNVPDIVTSGWGTKGWIYEEDRPKLYKLGIHDNHSEEALGEVLAASLAHRIFKDDEVLKYELRKVGNRYASVAPLMINIDEELIPLSFFINGQTEAYYRNRNINKELATKFFEAIKQSEIPGLYEFFVKLACLRDLAFVSDLHFNNISIIKNEKTGQIRIAPIYDLGGAFGSTNTGKNIIANPNQSTLFLIYYLFSDLDPNWDYSWYNPDSLIGFEDEIRKTLSKSDFYTPELIEMIVNVYQKQKETLDKIAKVND